MFGGKKKSIEEIEAGDVNTLIGEGCFFEGNLNLSTATRIDGKVKGNIHSEGMLIIGESGSVEGDINCTEVLIHGTVRGNVTARRIELRRGASLSGDIRTDVFIIEEGALYNGHCSMGGSPVPETESISVPD